MNLGKICIVLTPKIKPLLYPSCLGMNQSRKKDLKSFQNEIWPSLLKWIPSECSNEAFSCNSGWCTTPSPNLKKSLRALMLDLFLFVSIFPTILPRQFDLGVMSLQKILYLGYLIFKNLKWISSSKIQFFSVKLPMSLAPTCRTMFPSPSLDRDSSSNLRRPWSVRPDCPFSRTVGGRGSFRLFKKLSNLLMRLDPTKMVLAPPQKQKRKHFLHLNRNR